MKAAHLCIDLQRSQAGYFIEDETENEWQNVIVGSTRLKHRLAGLGIPTIHVAFISARDNVFLKQKVDCMEAVNHDLAKVGIDLRTDMHRAFSIPVASNELVITKPCYSVTSAQGMIPYLRGHDIQTVILSGVFEARTEEIGKSCISVSAATLANRGFTTVIAAEATNNHFCRPMPLEERQKLHAPYGIAVQPIEQLIKPFVEEFRKNQPRRPDPATMTALTR